MMPEGANGVRPGLLLVLFSDIFAEGGRTPFGRKKGTPVQEAPFLFPFCRSPSG